jgi:hypothetical protein
MSKLNNPADRFPPFKIELAPKDIRRIFSKVIRAQNGCWLWTAGKNEGGYGQIRFGKKMWIAHRLFYYLYNGSIEQRLYVCHTCDTPACVNPKHLFPGTAKDNMDDCFKKGRHTNIFTKGRIPENASIAKKLAGKILLHLADHPNDLPAAVAKKYNVPVHLVKDIKRGRSYSGLVEHFDCD